FERSEGCGQGKARNEAWPKFWEIVAKRLSKNIYLSGPGNAGTFFMNIRIGFGIDFHQLAEGRQFWLGGVQIPAERGAVGHSDADVLIHAICDALLGALALGDIGQHFPNTDPAYKDID